MGGMAAEPQVQSSGGRRITGVLLAFFNLAGALLVVFFGLLADGLRCDDNCSVAPGWRNDPNAWQWRGILVLTLVILGSAVLINVAGPLRRARKVQLFALGTQLVVVVFLALLSITASQTHGGWNYLVLLFVFFAVTGAGSAWLAPD
jgi:MFS family permease